MNLNSQVCTVDQSKRLKQLGIRQDSLLAWVSNNENPILNDSKATCIVAAAFTTAELGVIYWLDMEDEKEFIVWFGYPTNESSGNWCCQVFLNKKDNQHENHEFFAETEAIVRAETLIFILEKNFYSPEEINSLIEGCSISQSSNNDPDLYTTGPDYDI